MARLIDRIIRMAWGTTSPGMAGRMKLAQGVGRSDSRDVYIGLALLGLSYLRRTQQRRELIYRREIPEGAAPVIHNNDESAPRLEIVKPKKPKKSKKRR